MCHLRCSSVEPGDVVHAPQRHRAAQVEFLAVLGAAIDLHRIIDVAGARRAFHVARGRRCCRGLPCTWRDRAWSRRRTRACWPRRIYPARTERNRSCRTWPAPCALFGSILPSETGVRSSGRPPGWPGAGGLSGASGAGMVAGRSTSAVLATSFCGLACCCEQAASASKAAAAPEPRPLPSFGGRGV